MTVICILSQQLWHLVFHAFINFVVRQRCLIECHQVGGSFLLFFFAVFYSVSVFALSTKQFLLSLPVRISAVLVVEEARYPRVQKASAWMEEGCFALHFIRWGRLCSKEVNGWLSFARVPVSLSSRVALLWREREILMLWSLEGQLYSASMLVSFVFRVCLDSHTLHTHTLLLPLDLLLLLISTWDQYEGCSYF